MSRAKELAEDFLHYPGGPKGWAAEFNIYGADTLYKLDGPYWKLWGEVLRVAHEVLREEVCREYWEEVFEGQPR